MSSNLPIYKLKKKLKHLTVWWLWSNHHCS
jgi:hypothetical protein